MHQEATLVFIWTDTAIEESLNYSHLIIIVTISKHITFTFILGTVKVLNSCRVLETAHQPGFNKGNTYFLHLSLISVSLDAPG